jgi:uncharacterized RDD family membrane protein YckC
LPADSAFCPACGSPVPGSPVTAAPGPAPASMFQPQSTIAVVNYASVGDRFVAVLIDHIILAFVSLAFVIPAFILGAFAFSFGFALFFGPLILLDFLLWLLYFSYFEGTTGQTFGKSLVGIKVVDEATQRPIDMGRALIRNLLRIIDWLPFFYILGFILVEVEEKKKRLGDMAANTVVVKETH